MQRRRNRKIIEDEELEGKQSLQKPISGQSSASKSNGVQNCAICWSELNPVTAVLPCGHQYCKPCFEDFLRSFFANHIQQNLMCPLCRANFTNYLICNKQQNIFQPFHIVSLGAQSQSSSFDSSSYLSSSFMSSTAYSISNNDCVVCLCNENLDQMIMCRNCQSVIGHIYCLPDRIMEEKLCQTCAVELAEIYRIIQ